jgi:hypothetical protein
MTEEDFRRAQQLFLTAGYKIENSWYDEKLFGSWAIELTRDGLPKQQVVWDGKEGWLSVEAFASNGTRIDKWVGKKKSEQNPDAALAQLAIPITREWEEKVERERAEYWKKFQLEQALSRVQRLWDGGCYSDYVNELSPYQEQLSAAQLKRLDIAKQRAENAAQSSNS